MHPVCLYPNCTQVRQLHPGYTQRTSPHLMFPAFHKVGETCSGDGFGPQARATVCAGLLDPGAVCTHLGCWPLAAITTTSLNQDGCCANICSYTDPPQKICTNMHMLTHKHLLPNMQSSAFVHARVRTHTHTNTCTHTQIHHS